MSGRAVLYTRVSTERQAERDLSLPNQRRQIEAFCKREDLSIVGEYSDEGLSARSDRRPEFQRMIADAAKRPREFDEVIVYNWSRLFRNTEGALFYIGKLERLGVRVRAVTQDVGDDASGRLLRTILAATDEHASEMIGERTLGGMEENIRRGYANGVAPFGFRSVEAGRLGDKIKKKFEHQPAEADVVRSAFTFYLEGDGTTGSMGIKGVTENLNQKGFRQRNGSPFTVKQVHKILRNEAYAGTYYWNQTDSRTKKAKPKEEWVSASVPAIVSKEAFEAVQRKLKGSHWSVQHTRRVNNPFLLSGLIRCGHCGSAMTRGIGKSEKYRYYMCSGKNRVGSARCTGQYLRMSVVDDLVLAGFIDRILEPAHLTELVREVLAELRKRDSAADSTKRSLETEIRRLQQGIDNIIRAVADGTVDQDGNVKAEIDRRKASIADLRRRLTETQPGGPVQLQGLTDQKIRAFGQALRRNLETGDVKMRQQYLRLFIDRIEAKDGELVVRGKPEALACCASNDRQTADKAVNAYMAEWRPHGDSNPGRRRERAKETSMNVHG